MSWILKKLNELEILVISGNSPESWLLFNDNENDAFKLAKLLGKVPEQLVPLIFKNSNVFILPVSVGRLPCKYQFSIQKLVKFCRLPTDAGMVPPAPNWLETFTIKNSLNSVKSSIDVLILGKRLLSLNEIPVTYSWLFIT